MQNSKSIGNKIAVARKKINLSQAELAQQVSISSQAVGKWERGESLPDILTLSRIAHIVGVDLNYFSESFNPMESDDINTNLSTKQSLEFPIEKPKKNHNWNMSESNWENVDFSGLKNLQEQFNSSNVKNCKFIGSDFSCLTLKNNNFDGCDFSGSNFAESRFHKSNIANSSLIKSFFKGSEFTGSFIYGCNLAESDFTDVLFKDSGFEKNMIGNAVWNCTSFVNTRIANVVFEGTVKDCSFEKCTFSKVRFQNAVLLNTFFKYNILKHIKFSNCQADRLTYELLKNGKADLSNIELIS